MATAKTKRCPACARHHIKGKQAIVSGKLRRVCLVCAANAVRIVSTITTAKCVGRHCNGAAAYCATCAERDKAEALAAPLAPIRAALEAMIRGLVHVQARDEGEAVEDYLRGKIEGLETALALVAR